MRCWECKKEIQRSIRVCYLDDEREKTRDICPECEKLLTYNSCHFVEVERITRGQLSRHNIDNLSAKEQLQ